MTGPDDGRSATGAADQGSPDANGTPLRTARSDVHPDDAPDDMTPGTGRGGEADTGEPGSAVPANEPPTGSDARPDEADRMETDGT